jgi:5-formyltetrahydrofolate cyclo-ligase
MSFHLPSHSSLPARKDALRAEIRARLRSLPPDDRAKCSQEIVKQLCELAPMRKAVNPILFASLPSEPDLSGLPARLALRSFLLPRVEEAELRIHRVETWDDLVRGRFQVNEPHAMHHPVVDPSSADLVLVPGVAFTRSGIRMGRGGGFYDRFLASLPAEIPRIGVCFHCQLVDQIPQETHDVPVDAVVSERGIVWAAGQTGT